jgi:hypothetical protein
MLAWAKVAAGGMVFAYYAQLPVHRLFKIFNKIQPLRTAQGDSFIFKISTRKSDHHALALRGC